MEYSSASITFGRNEIVYGLSAIVLNLCHQRTRLKLFTNRRLFVCIFMNYWTEKITNIVDNVSKRASKPEINMKFRHWSGSWYLNWSYSPGNITEYSMFSLNFVNSVSAFELFLLVWCEIARRLLPWPDGSNKSKQKSGWQSTASIQAFIWNESIN